MSGAACCGCGADLGPVRERVAGISVFVAGDERIDSWFWCGACRKWTLRQYYDSFMGDSTVSTRGPYEKEEGDARVALIRRCLDPMDKWCECAAHREYGIH